MEAKVGAGAIDSRIGVKDSETSTDGMTNSTNPSAEPNINSACDEMIPTICTIM